jgi:hypothetical protein
LLPAPSVLIASPPVAMPLERDPEEWIDLGQEPTAEEMAHNFSLLQVALVRRVMIFLPRFVG